MVSALFTFSVYSEFMNHLEGWELKRKQHGNPIDSQKKLGVMAEYLEQFVKKLTFEDIDVSAAIPPIVRGLLTEMNSSNTYTQGHTATRR